MFWRINTRPDELEQVFVYHPKAPPPPPRIAKLPRVYPARHRATVSNNIKTDQRRRLPRSPQRLAPEGFELVAIDIALHPHHDPVPQEPHLLNSAPHNYLRLDRFDHHHIWDVVCLQQSQAIAHRRDPTRPKPPGNLVVIPLPFAGVVAYILLQQLAAGKPVAWQETSIDVYIFTDSGVEHYDRGGIQNSDCMREGDLEALYLCEDEPFVDDRWRVVCEQHPRQWAQSWRSSAPDAGFKTGVHVEWEDGMREWFEWPNEYYLTECRHGEEEDRVEELQEVTFLPWEDPPDIPWGL